MMEIWTLVLITLLFSVHGLIAITASIAFFRDTTLPVANKAGGLFLTWVVPFFPGLLFLKAISDYGPQFVPEFARSGVLYKIVFSSVVPPNKLNLDAPDSSDGRYSQGSDFGDVGFESSGQDSGVDD
jgi:hypothetical protein